MTKNLENRENRIHDATTTVSQNEVPDGMDALTFFEDSDGQWDHERQMQFLLDSRGTPGPAAHALSELDEIQEKINHLEQRYLKLWKIANGERAYQSRTERVILEQTAEDIENGGGTIDESPSYFEGIRAAIVELGEIDLDPTCQR